MRVAVPLLEEWCLRRGRLILIAGREDPENVYLRRMPLFRSRLLSIYIHRFMRSDKGDHHDHPFSFLSYIVKGGYRESRVHGSHLGRQPSAAGTIHDVEVTQEQREAGTFAYRKAKDIHMVFIDRHYTAEEYKKAPLTVIFRGPYLCEWGFWIPSGKKSLSWVYWREYLGVPEDDVRE